jgi:polyvinyl alcohol dehydrogenase (cytochrome)
MKTLFLVCIVILPFCLAQVPSFGYNVQNTRMSTDTSFTAQNVNSLSQVWTYSTGGPVMASPITATINSQAIVFVPTYDGYLHAIVQDTGVLLWKVKISTYTGVSTSTSRTTAAVYNNIVVIGDNASCKLMAINALTGDLIWLSTLDTQIYCLFTQSPTISTSGDIYIGIASNEEYWSLYSPGYQCCVFMGAMFKVSITDGTVQWKLQTVPNNGGAIGGYSGASIWGSSPSLDYSRNSLYIATGNNYQVPASVASCINSTSPSNKLPCLDPNDYVDSIVSIDMTTGAVNWNLMIRPDVWNQKCNGGCVKNGYSTDSDFMQGAILTTITVNGQPLDVLITVQKNGNVWCLKRDDGTIIWQSNVNSCYLSFGSAVDDNYVYIAGSDGGKGTNMHNGQACGTGHWIALDKNTGAFIWERCNPGSTNVGSPVTVVPGGILFAGAWDGNLYALNTADGSTLWSANLGKAVKASGAAVTNGMVIVGTGYRGDGASKIAAYKLASTNAPTPAPTPSPTTPTTASTPAPSSVPTPTSGPATTLSAAPTTTTSGPTTTLADTTTITPTTTPTTTKSPTTAAPTTSCPPIPANCPCGVILPAGATCKRCKTNCPSTTPTQTTTSAPSTTTNAPTTTTTSGPATTAPPSTIYGNYKYYLVSTAYGPASAQNNCVAKYGGNLAAITSSGLNTFLKNTFGNTANADYWIGLKKTSASGSFFWIDGQSVSYTNWDTNQPDTSNNNVIFVNSITKGTVGKWKAISSDQVKPSLCEVKLSK